MILDNNIDKFETNILMQINHILEQKHNNRTLSEMSFTDRSFLNGIIRKLKPNKILEIGLVAGGSSAIILNAIKDFENSTLYSIDYNTKYYQDNSKNTGFIVNDYLPELKNKWNLYTGGVSAKFIEDIGNNIDVCLLDTMHCNPGEILDFLTVLPYLKENAILILHDTLLYAMEPYIYNFRYGCTTNGTLFSAIKGKKIHPNEGHFGNFGNIGAIILDSDIKDRVFDYIYLLTLPWSYLPTDLDIMYFQKLFSKNYDAKINEYFNGIVLGNSKNFIEMRKTNELNNSFNNKLSDFDNKFISFDNKLNLIDNKLNSLINKLAWWIPIKKARNKFRNDLMN